MDSTLIIQLSFYLLVALLIVVLLFKLFKGILTFVFVRKPKQPHSQRFVPREPTTTIEELEIVSLSQVSQGSFVGYEEQQPNARCRKTGMPMSYCDCSRCRRKNGKVKS